MESKEEFDEVLWNKDRELLQFLVEEKVKELAEFMGCNSFTLPFDNFTVKVTPSGKGKVQPVSLLQE